MKKCVMCGRLIEGYDPVCGSCGDFLKWKYPKGYWKRINHFKKFSKVSNSIKCYRRKK